MTVAICFPHHLQHDGQLLLGLSCESGCACHSFVVGSYEQLIGFNYLGPGAWGTTGATTRCRQVGWVILTAGKESRSLWGSLQAMFPLVDLALFRVQAYQVVMCGYDSLEYL